MTMKEMIWAAVWRGIRIGVAQIPALVAYLHGLGSPLWVALGGLINVAAKFCRDKWNLDWIPA